MFQVPYSDDAPSTPASRKGTITSPDVSTTPAGPPPDLNTSTTPAGPPPLSSIYGSSNNISAIPFSLGLNRHIPSSPPQPFGESLQRLGNSYNVRRSAAGNAPAPRRSEKHDTDVSVIARPLSQPLPKQLWEDNEFILSTERLINDLSASLRRDNLRLTSAEVALSSVIDALDKNWSHATGRSPQSDRIGPDGDAPLPKASFVAGLLLQLHQPDLSRIHQARPDNKPVPQVLLDWLNIYHWPLRKEVEDVMTFSPNPTAHGRFWDILYSICLHGDFEGAIQLLDQADFSFAITALDDGEEQPGYRGVQLGNTHRVIKRCIQVLDSCPGLQRGDWDIKNSDWTVFRRRVQQAVTDLEEFAEGDSADRFAGDESEMRGSSLGLSMSQKSRRAESKVPWSVYQALKYLYGQLLGTRSELVAASADWVEAALSTVIWWDGEDDDAGQENLAASRRIQRRPLRDRLVDADTHEAYMQKLSATVELYLAEPQSEEDVDLQVSPVDHVEVALACALCGEVEGLVNIVRGWSTVISTAIVEMADMGGWLNSQSSRRDDMHDFNESDLMVLSYGGQRPRSINKDEILIQYADLLAKRSRLQGGQASGDSEGWQLAVQVLSRVKDEETADRRMTELLERLDMTDATQVQFTVRLCGRLGLQEQSKRLSSRYADHLMENNQQYGEAINHYVHAGQEQKISEVFQLLTSFSLVQSMAYPPAQSLDQDLLQLCTSPKQTVASLHRLNPTAGDVLLKSLSGYATLRKFYDLRDHDLIKPVTDNKNDAAKVQPSAIAAAQAMRPFARKRQAAAALVALIESASDGIHGGLYDESVQSAVPVECVVPLLGEALAFVNLPNPILTTPQLFSLLKAVEDISTVSSTIQSQSESCLRATLAAYRDPNSISSPTGAMAALRKSTSGLSASSNTFSLIGSHELRSKEGSKQTGGSRSSEGSGVLVNGHGKGKDEQVKRAWDWRAGFGRDEEVRAETVLRILRLQLADEVARAWVVQR